MTNKFNTAYHHHAYEGDFISASINGLDVMARIHMDECADTPEERQDGFWPVTGADNKDRAGYVSTHTNPYAYMAAYNRAVHVMNAWKRDEWFYCGVVVTVYFEGMKLASASLWGIECNYPDADNSYLTEVANELLREATDSARETLAKACAAYGLIQEAS